MIPFLKKPRMSRSKDLTLVLERDPEDEEGWFALRACEGEMPEHLGNGYRHRVGCNCSDGGKLCDVGWLEEFIACVGTKGIVKDPKVVELLERERGSYRIQLRGQMVSERYDSIEGTEYDEYFEVLEAEPLGAESGPELGDQE